jgi:hypothetical protein
MMIKEGGVMNATVTQNATYETMVEGKLVYDGMSTILSASRKIYNASSTYPEPGFCTY